MLKTHIFLCLSSWDKFPREIHFKKGIRAYCLLLSYLFPFILSSWSHEGSLSSLSFYRLPFPLSFPFPHMWHLCCFLSSFYLFILSSWTHVCSVFVFLSFYLFSFYLVILSSWTHVSSLSSLSFYLIPFPLSFPFVAHMWHLCLFIILSVYPFQLDPCSVFIFLSFYLFPFYLVILSSWIHVVSGSEGLLVCG